MALNTRIDCVHYHMQFPSSAIVIDTALPTKSVGGYNMRINCTAVSVKPRTSVQMRIVGSFSPSWLRTCLHDST